MGRTSPSLWLPTCKRASLVDVLVYACPGHDPVLPKDCAECEHRLADMRRPSILPAKRKEQQTMPKGIPGSGPRKPAPPVRERSITEMAGAGYMRHAIAVGMALCSLGAHAQPNAIQPSPQRTTQPTADPDKLDCAYAWQKMAPWSFSIRRCEFFVAEHERRGIKQEWPYSFAYGMSGSGMVEEMTYSAGGMTARGLMDCTELQVPKAEALRRFGTTNLHHPELSIANHCAQAGRMRGRTGWSRMRYVFLPMAPDGRRAYQEQRRWQGIAARFRRVLAWGYMHGEIAK